MDNEYLFAAVKLMGQGMLGIFVVMTIIAGTIYGMTRICERKSKKSH